jgi:hypothetical protein
VKLGLNRRYVAMPFSNSGSGVKLSVIVLAGPVVLSAVEAWLSA